MASRIQEKILKKEEKVGATETRGEDAKTMGEGGKRNDANAYRLIGTR